MQVNAYKTTRLPYLIDVYDFTMVDNGGGTPQPVYAFRTTLEADLYVDMGQARISVFTLEPVDINYRFQNIRLKSNGEKLMPLDTYYNVSAISPVVNVAHQREGYQIRANLVYIGNFLYQFEEDQV